MIHYNPEEHQDLIVDVLVKDLSAFVEKYNKMPVPAVYDRNSDIYFRLEREIYIIPFLTYHNLQFKALHKYNEQMLDDMVNAIKTSEQEVWINKEMKRLMENGEDEETARRWASYACWAKDIDESPLKEGFSMDGFITKPEHYNMECQLSDAPTEMPEEKLTMKVDYTK